jgi:hypothetical protein
MPVDRRDPERLLIERQEQAAWAKRQPRRNFRWPASGEFVVESRTGTSRGLHEPMLRFISAVEARQMPASGVPRSERCCRPPKALGPLSKPQEAGRQHPNTLSARSLKVTVVLNAAEVADLVVREGERRVMLTIRLPDRSVMADIASKSARRAIAAIREHSINGVTCIVQGKLVEDRIEEVGLAIQPRVKPSGETAT